MNKNIIAGGIAGILVIGIGSFYGGIKYAGPNTSPNRNLASAGQAGQFRTGQINMRTSGGQGMAAMTLGQIIAKDDSSITVKLPAGGSKIVFFTESTSIIKSTAGAVVDLKINENVIVSGSTNSDGSVNAESVQLGALPRFGQGQNRPIGNGTSQNLK